MVGVGLEGDASAGGRISISAACAQELGHHFHRFVRLVGVGHWRFMTCAGRLQAVWPPKECRRTSSSAC